MPGHTRDETPAARKRGRHLTPAEVVDQVRHVFELTKNSTGQGNYSETARICKVSHVTVRKIVLRTHGRPAENQGTTLEPGETLVTPRRCDGCNGLVKILPCRYCKIRATAAPAAGLADGHGPGGIPRRRITDARGQRLLPIVDEQPPAELEPMRDSFELKAAQRRRLEEVRARRERLDPFANIKRGPRPRDRRQTNRQECPF